MTPGRRTPPLPVIEHRVVETGTASLHVVTAGPKDGPLVLLLHGFPEFWFGWRYQIGPLAEAGYRVWAPDQRGYNRSEKPTDIAAYRLDELAADVVALIETAGRASAAVVGHDWGAAVGWWAAATYPRTIERLVPINVPHPTVFRRFLLRDPRQLARSWYTFLFQLPSLPEAMFRARNYRLPAWMLRVTSNPGTFPEAVLDRYRRSWSRPGAPAGMINWYRAGYRTGVGSLASIRIRQPTLLVWGVNDVALGREMAPPSVEFCENGRLEFIEEATHWVQHETIDRVNTLLLGFLNRT